MLQREFLKNLERMARANKERACRRRPTDIPATIVGHRGEDPVIQVTLNRYTNLEMLKVAHMVANGMECDGIGLAHESYLAGVNPDTGQVQINNPLTDQPWDASKNEMANYAQHHDGLGKGLIVEIIVLFCVNRAGDTGMGALPYKYVGGKYLHWLDEDPRSGAWMTSDDGNEMSGAMTEGLRTIMLAPSMEQWLAQHPQDAEEVSILDRDARDSLVAQQIARRGHAPVLFAEVGTPRAATLDEYGERLRDGDDRS